MAKETFFDYNPGSFQDPADIPVLDLIQVEGNSVNRNSLSPLRFIYGQEAFRRLKADGSSPRDSDLAQAIAGVRVININGQEIVAGLRERNILSLLPSVRSDMSSVVLRGSATPWGYPQGMAQLLQEIGMDPDFEGITARLVSQVWANKIRSMPTLQEQIALAKAACDPSKEVAFNRSQNMGPPMRRFGSTRAPSAN